MTVPDAELHFATLWEAIADGVPDAPALTHGGQTTPWGMFEQRAAKVGGALTAAGLGPGSTVACCLYNCPAYFEIFFGALKVRAVPANINYRYTGSELQALLDNSDAEALFFDTTLAGRVRAIASEMPRVRLLVEVGGGQGRPAIDGAWAYEDLVATSAPARRIRRGEGDCFLSYTGGTTGLPKGVLYEIGRGVRTAVTLRDRFLDHTTTLGVVEFALQQARRDRPMSAIPASPLMHSTGFTYASLPTLTAGGRVITLESRSFRAEELFGTVGETRAEVIAIVGDAFAVPMLRALDEAKAGGLPYDTSSLRTICSAGTAWSAPVKSRLFEHIPQVCLVDSCGSTEGVTYGVRSTRRDDPVFTANFEAAPGLRVLSPQGQELPPGEIGLLAGPTPAAGYYQDAPRSAEVFVRTDRETFAIPGDLGRIEPDGTVTLVGRGNTTVNTGGEKVYPAEVEEVINGVAGVTDCVVIGVPDERWGHAVAALIARPDETAVSAGAIVAAVRNTLAGYKVPRAIRFVEAVPRGPNGKVDYPATAELLAGVRTEEKA